LQTFAGVEREHQRPSQKPAPDSRVGLKQRSGILLAVAIQISALALGLNKWCAS
jgi:hypothetical protein